MSVASLIAELTGLGIRLEACDGKVRVTPRDRLTESQRQALLENKPGGLGTSLPCSTPPAVEAKAAEPPPQPAIETPCLVSTEGRPQALEDAGPRPKVEQRPPTAEERAGKTAVSPPLAAEQGIIALLCPGCRPFCRPLCHDCELANDPSLEMGEHGSLASVTRQRCVFDHPCLVLLPMRPLIQGQNTSKGGPLAVRAVPEARRHVQQVQNVESYS